MKKTIQKGFCKALPRCFNGSTRLVLAFAVVRVLPLGATPPTIDYQPRSETVVVYQQAGFGVIASGTPPLYYQWRKGIVPIPGATNDQIVLPQPQFLDAGLYSVVVSNAEGSVISTSAGLIVKAPEGGDLDFSFTRGGLIYGPFGPFFSGSMVVQPDGKILVAGPVHGGIARLNADGTTDYTFMSNLRGVNGGISSVALQGDGKVLIAGSFTNINGTTWTNVARLNPDGTLDTGFLNVVFEVNGAPANIAWLTVQSDNQILVGGQSADGWWGFARLNPDGSLDNSFQNGVTAFGGDLYAFALKSDGELVTGGQPAWVGGVQTSGIARLNTDGSLDWGFLPSLDRNGNLNSLITALAVQSDGSVLIGGGFNGVNGEPRNGIARLNPDGSLDDRFQNGLTGVDWNGYYFPVESIAVQADGKVLIAGGFTNVNDEPRSGIVRLDPDGSLDDTFQTPSLVSPNSYGGGGAYYNPPDVSLVSLQSDGKLVIGGTFAIVDGQARNNLARLNADGSLDANFQDGVSGPNNAVSSIVIQNDGNVVLAGGFNTVNNQLGNYVTRLKPDGSVDSNFHNASWSNDAGGIYGASSRPWIYSLAMQGDGKLLALGQFTAVDGVAGTNLVRLNQDGTLDSGFQVPVGLGLGNGSGVSIALQSDGKILTGGYFSANIATNIARLNPDGSLDSSFRAVISNGGVNSIAVQTDGKVVIGGDFTTVNGTTRGGIARLNTDGSLDTGFQNGLSGISSTSSYHGPYVDSIVLQSDDRMIIAGYFTALNGVSRHNIARLNADGTLDATFQNGLSGVTANSPAGSVSTVAMEPNGRVIAVGWFDAVNGVGRNSIARLNTDGTLDNGFLDRASGPDSRVNAVVVADDGKIIVGGAFSTINGLPAAGIARLWGNKAFAPQLTSLTKPSNGSCTLTLQLQAESTNRVQFKNTLGDPAWTDLAGDIAVDSFNYFTNKVDQTLGGARQRFYRVWQLP